VKLTRSLSLFFALAAFALSAALYARLPALVPVHFDWHGHADDFMAKMPGAFLLPGTMGFLLVVFGVAGLATRMQAPLDAIEVAVTMFLFELHALVLGVALGHSISMNRATFAGLGVFFVVIGNHFGKLRRNHLVGIRTPWTLTDDENWLLTHRLGGPLFVGGGLALAVLALAGGPDALAWLLVAVIALVPVIYSYALSRRLSGGER
jgi:uncharacterized membrane protein